MALMSASNFEIVYEESLIKWFGYAIQTMVIGMLLLDPQPPNSTDDYFFFYGILLFLFIIGFLFSSFRSRLVIPKTELIGIQWQGFFFPLIKHNVPLYKGTHLTLKQGRSLYEIYLSTDVVDEFYLLKGFEDFLDSKNLAEKIGKFKNWGIHDKAFYPNSFIKPEEFDLSLGQRLIRGKETLPKPPDLSGSGIREIKKHQVIELALPAPGSNSNFIFYDFLSACMATFLFFCALVKSFFKLIENHLLLTPLILFISNFVIARLFSLHQCWCKIQITISLEKISFTGKSPIRSWLVSFPLPEVKDFLFDTIHAPDPKTNSPAPYDFIRILSAKQTLLFGVGLTHQEGFWLYQTIRHHLAAIEAARESDQ